VNFPFSHIAIKYLNEGISNLVDPSTQFVRECGEDYRLVFYISAKRALEENEIRGPAVFKKTKDVEYTLFLPFTVIDGSDYPPKAALQFLFQAMYAVFESFGIDTSRVVQAEESMIKHVCSDQAMFCGKVLESDAGPVWTATIDRSNDGKRSSV
jgi:hypothetical protein